MMRSKVPVVRQFSWALALPQFVVLALCVLLAGVLLWSRIGLLSFALGSAIYLTYSFGSRAFLLRAHRGGIKLSQQQNFDEAIVQFRESYRFCSKCSWIDNYRALTLMMPSAVTFREMALVNTAFCYGQIGDAPQMRAYYERALAEFPHSSMAQTALNFINTVQNQETG